MKELIEKILNEAGVYEWPKYADDDLNIIHNALQNEGRTFDNKIDLILFCVCLTKLWVRGDLKISQVTQ